MSTQLEQNLQSILTQKETYLIPANIRQGVTVLGVTGNLAPDKPDQNKTVTPTTSEQVITADTGYELAQVTVNPVTSSIDANITAGNIKSGVTILGVTGTLPSDISYGTTLPANPNPGDKFVKVNNDWTELDGIYKYDYRVYSVSMSVDNLTGSTTTTLIPNILTLYSEEYSGRELGLKLRSATNNNIEILYAEASSLSVTSTYLYKRTLTFINDTTPFVSSEGSNIAFGFGVAPQDVDINVLVKVHDENALEWQKIEFTNSVSGTEYDTAVDTTEDILGTSNGE